jgi:nucleolar protein 56
MVSRALATQWFGVFLYEDDDLVDRELFPARAEAIARRLEAVATGQLLDEERQLLDGVEDVRVADERLLTHAATMEGPVPQARQRPADHDLDPALRQEAAIERAEAAIEAQLSAEGRHLVQAVAYLDETHEIENRMIERLTSWFRLHAPALVDEVDDGVELARLVARHGDREAIACALDVDPGMGSALDPNEMRALEGLAASIVQQAQAREPLERFVTELAREMAPNIAQLTTPAIAARLIQHAGGLEELAKQPASTIQMLGAERAVFQHLTEDAPPPKHGVIFRHPMIHEAHPDDRGSIARAMAAKVAIAARADALTGNDIAGELEADLQARVDEIQRVGRRRAMRGSDR